MVEGTDTGSGGGTGAGAGAGGEGSSGGGPPSADAVRGVDAGRTMDGKYCIVTGSNSGIGLQVARGLMQRGAHVVMACRNMAACEEAAQRLRAEGSPGSCACRAIDLEDLDSIRRFAQQQAVELGEGSATTPPSGSCRCSGLGGAPAGRRIDVLVNNAGVMGVSRAADGSDRHLSANHLGPYLLTRLLLPHMTHGSRVVNVASRAHYAGLLALVTEPAGSEAVRDDVHHWWWQYARSKLCNVLFTAELQRRYGYGPRSDPAGGGGGGGGGGGSPGKVQRGIGVHAVSPGLVDTGIFRYLLPSWAQWLRTPLRPLFRTPEQGAEVVLFAACSPQLRGVNSLFLHDCREMKPSSAARDPQLAADLWRVSATLVGLAAEDDDAEEAGLPR